MRAVRLHSTAKHQHLMVLSENKFKRETESLLCLKRFRNVFTENKSK